MAVQVFTRNGSQMRFSAPENRSYRPRALQGTHFRSHHSCDEPPVVLSSTAKDRAPDLRHLPLRVCPITGSGVSTTPLGGCAQRARKSLRLSLFSSVESIHCLREQITETENENGQSRLLDQRLCPEYRTRHGFRYFCKPLHRVLFSFRSLYILLYRSRAEVFRLGRNTPPLSSICTYKQIYSRARAGWALFESSATQHWIRHFPAVWFLRLHRGSCPSETKRGVSFWYTMFLRKEPRSAGPAIPGRLGIWWGTWTNQCWLFPTEGVLPPHPHRLSDPHWCLFFLQKA